MGDVNLCERMLRVTPKQVAKCLLTADTRVGASVLSGFCLYLFSRCPPDSHVPLLQLARQLKFLTSERKWQAREKGVYDVCLLRQGSVEMCKVRKILSASTSPPKLYIRYCLKLETCISSAICAYDKVETQDAHDPAIFSLVQCSQQVRVLGKQFKSFQGTPPVNEAFTESLSHETLGVRPLDFAKAVDDFEKTVLLWFMGAVARDTSVW